jgi:hypothetical protein
VSGRAITFEDIPVLELPEPKREDLPRPAGTKINSTHWLYAGGTTYVAPAWVPLTLLPPEGWSTQEEVEDNRSVMALLQTLDGARKHVVVPWPPAPTYKTAVPATRIEVTAYGDAEPKYVDCLTNATRTYWLRDIERDHVRHLVRAVYEEQP